MTLSNDRNTMQSASVMTASVLIPTYMRIAALQRCLLALEQQTCKPHEVIVVWQADDFPSRDFLQSYIEKKSLPLVVLHSEVRGVVPSENLALSAATGEIILLIDDDAVAKPTWIEKHLAQYKDPKIGAVGGPADNYNPDGSKFPERDALPVGKLAWYGKMYGNMHTQNPAWQQKSPAIIDHLVGYNFSFRRSLLSQFESALRPYWQLFELDACLMVKKQGYLILFDYGNVVDHHPTNTAYTGGRDGNLEIKIFNAAYNTAFVLSKHTPFHLRLIRLCYLLFVGNVSNPGVIAAIVGWRRYGNLRRELSILFRCWRATLSGWFSARGVTN